MPTGTLAFESLAATNAAKLEGVVPGDVIEVPGTSVSGVIFGTNSLSVTTSAGTYAVTNVSYAAAVRGYTAAFDAATGLVAITFNDVDTFQRNVKATSGALSGDYLWSNAANWSAGVPTNGASISVGATGYDDLASLTLASPTLRAGSNPTLALRLGQLRDEPGHAVTNPRIRDGSTVAKASPAPCRGRHIRASTTSAYTDGRFNTTGLLKTDVRESYTGGKGASPGGNKQLLAAVVARKTA